MSSTLVIVNPRARQINARRIREISNLLAISVGPHEIVQPESPEEGTEAARRAAERNYGRVIAVGGDGVVHAVSNGLVGTDTALGVVPLGTGNFLARELGIPLNWRRACEALSSMRVDCLDTGDVNGRNWVLMVGMGLDAATVENVPPHMKRLFGRAAFIWSAYLTSVRFQPFGGVIRIDGKEVERTSLWAVIITNIKTYAGILDIAPDADMRDGLLDVMVTPEDLVRRMPLAAELTANILLNRPIKSVRRYLVHRVEIETDRPVPVQADGELVGTTPVSIRVHPCSLKVLAPKNKMS